MESANELRLPTPCVYAMTIGVCRARLEGIVFGARGSMALSSSLVLLLSRDPVFDTTGRKPGLNSLIVCLSIVV